MSSRGTEVAAVFADAEAIFEAERVAIATLDAEALIRTTREKQDLCLRLQALGKAPPDQIRRIRAKALANHALLSDVRTIIGQALGRNASARPATYNRRGRIQGG